MCLVSVAYCSFIKPNFIALLIRVFRAFTVDVTISIVSICFLLAPSAICSHSLFSSFF